MQTFTAEENFESNAGGEASVLVEDYKAIWGLSLPEHQVSLIDTVTDYRNNHRKMSFLMSTDKV